MCDVNGQPVVRSRDIPRECAFRGHYILNNNENFACLINIHRYDISDTSIMHHAATDSGFRQSDIHILISQFGLSASSA